MATKATVTAPPGSAPAPGSAESKSRQVVVFLLGGEEFALPIMSVEQIDGPLPVAAFPPAHPSRQLHPHLRGTTTLRGQTLPVLDLSARLGVAAALPGAGPDSRTLIVAIGGRPVALTVDRVGDVLCLKAGAVAPLGATRRNVDPKCIQGVIRIKGRSVLLLDPNHILEAKDLDHLPGGR